MKVAIISATEREIQLVKQAVESRNETEQWKFPILFQTTGVGILSSCYSISQIIYHKQPTLIIQAGIAGTFSTGTALGKTVVVKNEFLADTGVTENGSFLDLFDLNLQTPDLFPYSGKGLCNTELAKLNYLQLDEVTGVTINEITTNENRIEQLKKKYDPFTESMEGASLHYCCLQTSTPFIQLRALSNYVGERDKTKWKFKESFENLADTVAGYLQHLNSIF